MRRTLARPASAAVLALTLGLGLSACGGDDDTVSAEDRDQATQAAIAAVGGEASVTGVDDDDDQYAFEVEVQFAGGEDADVQLDEDFNVIGTPPTAPPAAAPSDDSSSTPAPSGSATPTPGGSDDLDDDGDNLTGRTLQQAARAALAETGGGRVTDAERADAEEDHAYEVEVRLDAATDDDDVSVELDEQLGVVRVDR